MPKATGRPTVYSKRIAEKVCLLVSEGRSLRTICSKSNLPSMQTIFRWLRENEEFRSLYVLAKEEAADLLVEEIKDIADGIGGDYITDKHTGSIRPNPVAVSRAKLQIESRKWLASKLKPKKYSDRLKVDAENTTSGTLTLKIANYSDTEDK